ncbi:MAG TPA: hypothetical protein VE954_27550 [Oligoflexus sp.]|uniref:hypothetical protein n=1 Tax=Oligoflexus sp. TaxID=1971216 RepID=UPI002D617EA7|nr:hypothetical protein [Oligoflexus sp.]HYX36881.1 hypothetical protein [Oligoflexus sp.]
MKKLMVFAVALCGLLYLGLEIFEPFATDHHEEEILLNAVPLLNRHADGLFILIKVKGKWTEEELARMLDPWGQQIRAEYQDKVLTLTSSGPDMKFETKDDINVERTIE